MDRPKAVELARLFHVLSSTIRLQILDVVATMPLGQATLPAISDALQQHAPGLTPHLRALVEAGVLRRHGQGRHAHYSLVPGALTPVTHLPVPLITPPQEPQHDDAETATQQDAATPGDTPDLLPAGAGEPIVPGSRIERLTIDAPGGVVVTIALRAQD